MSNIKKDLKSFIDNDQKADTSHLDKDILAFVQNDLQPNHAFVFIKLLLIQAFIGILTLAFCPQFKFSLTNNYELFHYFHYKFVWITEIIYDSFYFLIIM